MKKEIIIVTQLIEISYETYKDREHCLNKIKDGCNWMSMTGGVDNHYIASKIPGHIDIKFNQEDCLTP